MSYVRVASVESGTFALQKKLPPNVVVSAEGTVTTSGWKNGELTSWVYVTPPEDGILDLDFVAERPSGLVLQVISPIAGQCVLIDVDLENYWGPGKPLTGFRIHAANNEIVVPMGESIKEPIVL